LTAKGLGAASVATTIRKALPFSVSLPDRESVRFDDVLSTGLCVL
jgi:hypothetical protein